MNKITLLIGILLAAGVARAQTANTDWANVKRIAAGEEIRVSMSDGKSFRGQLQSSTADSLIMVAANSQQTLARPQVAKIATKRDSHRMRNTLIGLGLGAGAGLAGGAVEDHSDCAGRCGFGNNLGKVIFTPLGAVVGTVVGVAWPTGGWHEVYRSK
jgi:hypothetical protein